MPFFRVVVCCRAVKTCSDSSSSSQLFKLVSSVFVQIFLLSSNWLSWADFELRFVPPNSIEISLFVLVVFLYSRPTSPGRVAAILPSGYLYQSSRFLVPTCDLLYLSQTRPVCCRGQQFWVKRCSVARGIPFLEFVLGCRTSLAGQLPPL